MLKKVEIENFQSHKKSVLEFVPGTNVIIGESDAGKSAIFRAINWVISNRPLGDAFRSEWGGDTSVTLFTTDGHTVQRIRAASRNEYIIDGKAIKAFGQEVPQQVLDVLQLDEANIQAQMDAPFLLAATPGEAARLLNRAASIDDIDLTISNLKSAYTKIGNELKFNENKLAEHKQQLKQYDDIPVLEEKLQQVEEAENKCQQMKQNLGCLSNLVQKIENTYAELQKTASIPVISEKYERALERYKELDDKQKQLQQLTRLTQRVRERQEYLAATEYVDRCLTLTEQARERYQEYQDKQKEIASLKQVCNRISNTRNYIALLNMEISRLEQEFRKLCPDVCPLCGSEIQK